MKVASKRIFYLYGITILISPLFSFSAMVQPVTKSVVPTNASIKNINFSNIINQQKFNNTVTSSSNQYTNQTLLNKNVFNSAIIKSNFNKLSTPTTNKSTQSIYQPIRMTNPTQGNKNWWKQWLFYLGIGIGLSEFIAELYDDLLAQKVTTVTLQEIENQAINQLETLKDKSQIEIDLLVKEYIKRIITFSDSLSSLILLLELFQKAPNATTKEKVAIAISTNIVELGESFCKNNFDLKDRISCQEKTKKYLQKTLQYLIQVNPNSIINSATLAILKSSKPYAMIIAKIIPTALTGNLQFKLLSTAISNAPAITETVKNNMRNIMGISSEKGKQVPTNWRSTIKNWFGI